MLLTSVELLTERSPLWGGVPDEVATRIHGLLDCSALWSLDSASDAGLVHLLRRLAPLEWPGVGSEFRRLRYHSAIRRATEKGHLPTLQWWLESYWQQPEEPNGKLMVDMAVAYGHLHILQWLETQGRLAPPASTKPLVCAHPSVIYWFYDRGNTFPLAVSLGKAAKDGDVAFVQWMHKRAHRYPEVSGWSRIVYWAALYGHLPLLQWMRSNRPEDFTEDALLGAVEGGNLVIAQWLTASGLRLGAKMPWPTSLKAVDVSMAKWLIGQARASCSASERSEWIASAMTSAIRVGNLATLQLLSAYQPLDQSLPLPMDEAAQSGQLKVVQWLHELGFPCRSTAMDAAAAHGHLEVVQWLHHNRTEGCTVIASAMAALNGHMDVIQWLHEHRSASLNTGIMHWAVLHGHLAIVRYVHAHSDRADWWTGSELQNAAKNGHLATVKWLHENGLGGDVNADVVSANGHLEVVQYLMQHCNAKCTSIGAVFAAQAGHFALVEWLMTQDPSIVDPHLLRS